MDKDSNDLHSYLPASFSSLNEKEQSLLLEYVQSMDDLQKKALTIAKEHLKSSFQLQKSNGYSEWLKEREKRG